MTSLTKSDVETTPGRKRSREEDDAGHEQPPTKKTTPTNGNSGGTNGHNHTNGVSLSPVVSHSSTVASTPVPSEVGGGVSGDALYVGDLQWVRLFHRLFLNYIVLMRYFLPFFFSFISYAFQHSQYVYYMHSLSPRSISGRRMRISGRWPKT